MNMLSVVKRTIAEALTGRARGYCPTPLIQLRKLGFKPRSILDVGAYKGRWALAARRLFPEATIHMIEAQSAMAPALERMSEWYGMTFDIAVLGSRAADAVDFVQITAGDTAGCSLYHEQTVIPQRTIRLPMKRLDDLARPEFDLVKLDVQGAEVEVIKGGEKVVAAANVVILEASLVEYNKGAPLFVDVASSMQARGFCLLDIAEGTRRPGGELTQIDATFTRPRSPLRAAPPF